MSVSKEPAEAGENAWAAWQRAISAIPSRQDTNVYTGVEHTPNKNPLEQFKKKDLLSLQKRLRRLPIGGHSICFNLNSTGDQIVHVIFPLWPRHSGNPTYPVPHPSREPADAFYFEIRELWADTPYGNARRELVAFCISTIKAELLRRSSGEPPKSGG